MGERLGPNLKWILLMSSNEWLGARIEGRFAEQAASAGVTLEALVKGWQEFSPQLYAKKNDDEDCVAFLRRTWWYSSMKGFDLPATDGPQTLCIQVDDHVTKDDVKEKALAF